MSSIELVSKSQIEIEKTRIYNKKYQYKQKDLIGLGSFGCVYKVKDIQTNKM
jgi:hypothetical protein